MREARAYSRSTDFDECLFSHFSLLFQFRFRFSSQQSRTQESIISDNVRASDTIRGRNNAALASNDKDNNRSSAATRNWTYCLIHTNTRSAHSRRRQSVEPNGKHSKLVSNEPATGTHRNCAETKETKQSREKAVKLCLRLNALECDSKLICFGEWKKNAIVSVPVKIDIQW